MQTKDRAAAPCRCCQLDVSIACNGTCSHTKHERQSFEDLINSLSAWRLALADRAPTQGCIHLKMDIEWRLSELAPTILQLMTLAHFSRLSAK